MIFTLAYIKLLKLDEVEEIWFNRFSS